MKKKKIYQTRDITDSGDTARFYVSLGKRVWIHSNNLTSLITNKILLRLFLVVDKRKLTQGVPLKFYAQINFFFRSTTLQVLLCAILKYKNTFLYNTQLKLFTSFTWLSFIVKNFVFLKIFFKKLLLIAARH